jgi:SAM-dependent methyltransferase
VLDLGCGEGRLARDLTALGYRTAGVDISRAMIAAARDADPSGRYEVANAAETPFADASFDLVTAFMSLQDMEDMPAAVAEAARVLRRGGCFGIAIVHPLNSAGGFESLAPEAAFRLEGPYLRERKYADEGGRDGLRIRFASYHRPLGAYFAALEEHGFLVDRLREVTVDARSVEARPDRERWLGIPLFLHLRALRP